MSRIYKAIVLNEPYAGLVKTRQKDVETRWKRFKYSGDIVICCGKRNDSVNAGYALCIVNLGEARLMRPEDAEGACIEFDVDRVAYDLTNWRYFSKEFQFVPQRVRGSYQSIFEIEIPDDVEIISEDEWSAAKNVEQGAETK